MKYVLVLGVLVLCFVASTQSDAEELTPLEELGKELYFDTNLSTPAGQSCASCHTPEAGFADPDSHLPVSEGVRNNRVGNRNSPSAAYAAFSPDFHFDEEEGLYIGGQFWDGRAANLVEQAKGPFLNPLEMANPSKKQVVLKVSKSDYAQLFLDVWGPDAFRNVETAYESIAIAIAAFESTPEVSPFSSKYDAYMAGETMLSPAELRGLELFEGKAQCNLCHPSEGLNALFTDFSYDNLGVFKNPDNPFYFISDEWNPDGVDFVDLGLGGVLNDPAEIGKHKVPTLRNIAVTPPYMHNGALATLTEVVDFYNTRDVAMWPPPEVAENVNTDELGDLGLTDAEVADVVAFMLTLTDGWVPMGMAMVPPAAQLATVELQAKLRNSPNPFNPATQIWFQVPTDGPVHLDIYDVAGRRVTTLVGGDHHAAGEYSVVWRGVDDSGSPLASGVYLARMQVPGQSTSHKLLLAQ